MTLIGSASRVVASGKAVQTVYWRAAQKQGAEGSKIIKTKKTMQYGGSNSSPTVDLSRSSQIWRNIPSGYIPIL